MPTIFVKGRQVPVSGDFFNLPPEEQEATVRRIAEQIAFDAITGPLRPGQPSTNTSAKADRELSVGEYAEDAAKSLGVGVAKGGIGLAGTGGDIREGIAGASGWLAEKLGVSPQSSKRFADVVRDGIAANPALPMHGPTSDEITDLVRRATTPAPTLTQLVTESVLNLSLIGYPDQQRVKFCKPLANMFRRLWRDRAVLSARRRWPSSLRLSMRPQAG